MHEFPETKCLGGPCPLVPKCAIFHQHNPLSGIATMYFIDIPYNPNTNLCPRFEEKEVQ